DKALDHFTPRRSSRLQRRYAFRGRSRAKLPGFSQKTPPQLHPAQSKSVNRSSDAFPTSQHTVIHSVVLEKPLRHRRLLHDAERSVASRLTALLFSACRN